MTRARKIAAAVAALPLVFSATLAAQSPAFPAPLDPARGVTLQPAGQRPPLPEEYLWTAGDETLKRPDRSKYSWARTDLRIAPHFFRAHFRVDHVPADATLYVAGPRSARVWLNGTLLGSWSTNPDQPINFRVFHADALHALHPGNNVLAIEAVRGRGVVSGAGPLTTHMLAYGEVLAVKLLAGRFGDEAAPALLLSTPAAFRSVASTPLAAWTQAAFNDTSWPAASSLGPVDSDVNFFQWSADAGMYGWPGYRGMSPALRTLPLRVAAVSHPFNGSGDLPEPPASAEPGTVLVRMPLESATDAEAPSVLLDFGRELSGRLLVDNPTGHDALLSVAYGESELEALATGITPTQRGGNYLGTNLLDVPAIGVARGPKSAFRYVRVRFLRGAPELNLRLRAEAIVYPVEYAGSFESSDPLLNRIWETGAYTAHLCMQDGIWDAPKRDRGRWSGDLYMEGKTIAAAFGDKALMEETLRWLSEGTGAGAHVNGIPGYTATWITTLADLYATTGDLAFVQSQHEALLHRLSTLDADLDPSTRLLRENGKGWGFVDWAPGLYANTPETRTGTTLEYLLAYQAAPALLTAMGDATNAARYRKTADALRLAATSAFIDPQTHTMGRTWQLNALGQLSGVGDSAALWAGNFAHVKQDSPTDPVISPYFNGYLIEAMAQSGHPRETLDWIRAYWGGMLAEGATSFWESYDLRWPKTNFHLSLEADGTSGYFVSLAHGWSSGPTPWLTEHVLGVRPAAPGFAAVSLRPDLMGLAFARGTVPTPHGVISISLDKASGVKFTLPRGVEQGELWLPGATTPIRITHSGEWTFSWTGR